FNGDGALDLAVANGLSDGAVSILLGNDDGTFQAAVNYAVGPSPTDVTVGDFNGDGKLDLVVTAASGVSTLKGNGDGTSQVAVTYAPGGNATSLGDLNGDGFLDLAVTTPSGVAVMLNAADWPPAPFRHFPALVTPTIGQATLERWADL